MEPPLLLARLLAGDGDVCSPTQASTDALDLLAEISSSSPTLEWFGVNERRVDATVSSASGQYRIVYFSADREAIDQVWVYRRPRLFDGVEGGRVVVVNGPSGAGKSSVLSAIAASSRLPWVIFDEPVVGSVDETYLIWRGHDRGCIGGSSMRSPHGAVAATWSPCQRPATRPT